MIQTSRSWLSTIVADMGQRFSRFQEGRKTAKEASRLAHERRVRDGTDPDAIPWVETDWVDADGEHHIE